MSHLHVVVTLLIGAALGGGGGCVCRNTKPALVLDGHTLEGSSFAFVVDGSGLMVSRLQHARDVVMKAMTQSPGCRVALLRTSPERPVWAWRGLQPNNPSLRWDANEFLSTASLHGMHDHAAAMDAAYATGAEAVIYIGMYPDWEGGIPIQTLETHWVREDRRLYVVWWRDAEYPPGTAAKYLATKSGGDLLLLADDQEQQ